MSASRQAPSPPRWHGFASTEHLVEALANEIADIVGRRLAAGGSAFVAFPGGASPRRALERLAPLASEWAGVTIIPTDDRLVPRTDPLSNYAALAACFEGTAVRLIPMVRPPLENPYEVAEAAELRLSALPWPLDLVWLGFGADGHVASLLPGPDLADALSYPEWRRIAGVTPVPLPPEAPVARVTLTLSAIIGAQRVLVSGSGSAKLAAVKSALQRGPGTETPLGAVLAHAQNAVDLFWSR